jgi:hypothetical protein
MAEPKIKLTAQEAFDTVARHLIAQGHAAQSEDGEASLYRAPDDSRCAVGCLIPDDLYGAQLEGARVTAAEFEGIFPSDLHELLTRLQYVHDAADPTSAYFARAAALSSEFDFALLRARLSEAAEDFGLSPAVLAEAA